MRLATAFAAAVAASVFVGLGTSTARADIINISGDAGNSTEGLGDFTGTIEYNSLGGSLGSLIVTLTNTSDEDNGGFITGFLFNMNSADATAALSSATHPFDDCEGNGLNGQPFGDPFDAGAALGGKFEGGGNPNDGIAVGETGTFEFDVVATDAASLSAADFMSGDFDFNFVVRFRGFEDDGSDKVPAIPAPASLALFAGGAMAMGSRRRGRGF